MFRSLRILVLLLLALALPLQGIAATTMRFCLPVHPAIPAAAVAQHAAHGHGNAAHDGAHHHAVADGDQDHAGHAPPSAVDVSDAPIDTAASGTCSVCAACSAAALPQMALPLLADAPEIHLAQPLFEAHAGLTPGGLERPPRSSLA